jgi:hypothetical protein
MFSIRSEANQICPAICRASDATIKPTLKTS